MEALARVYSKALFEAATAQGKVDRIRAQLAAFVDALDRDRELAFFFFSPYFSSREKREGLEKALVGADQAFVNFLYVLLDKHRMPVIFRIRKRYEELWAEANRLLNVEVVSAVKLDEKTLQEIRQRVETQTGRKVDLRDRVDEYVIGGMVLRVGNVILDASIRNQLERLRKQVARA